MAFGQKTWKSRKINPYKPGRKSFKLSRQRGKPRSRFGSLKKSTSKLQLLLKKGIIFLFLCGMAAVVCLVLMFYYYSRELPSIAKIKQGTLIIAESTKIYDRTGEQLLYNIHGEENRTKVPLDQIPDNIKWATIATEDQDFYTRGLAIDFKGLSRAVLSVLKNRSLRESPGGSTITQQLVKNLILTREKTIARKIKEIILAFRLEKTLTREEILELYLNQIPYGSNAYGVEQAAQTFFDKPVTKLSLAESAILAALPKATTYYSPYGSHQDKLFARQKIILGQMLDQGYITEDQWKQATQEQIKFADNITNIQAPHFVIYIKELLARRYGETQLEQGGLKVITTLDYDLQQIAEDAVKQGALENDQKGASNAALVAIDPKTGEILAMVGSRDYFDKENQGNFNVALAPRQPGSSFKPIIYATLFSLGYTPNTILFDVETDFNPGQSEEYTPLNFDSQERGPVSIRKALAGSLNIPAVKALYLAGIYRVLDYAAKLGYSTLTDPSRFGLSLALGGGEVKLLEHVYAFSVLANQGVRQPMISILKVEDASGEILDEFKPTEGLPVFDRNVALMVTDILADNNARAFVFGQQNPLYLGSSIPVAAKTGTTNDYRDAWTIGYTSNLAAGVWVGNNDNSKMHVGIGGSKAAAPIWNNFMKQAVQKRGIEFFEKPEIPKTGKPILDGNIEQIKKVKIDKISGKLATKYTPPELIIEKAFADFHCILHYLEKEDPLGPIPENPNIDPQYQNWEQAVLRWAQESEQLIEFKKAPTEEDDVHLPDMKPVLNILFPVNNQLIKDKSILVEVSVESHRQIGRVEYYVDNVFRESAGLFPYSRRIYFGSLEDGSHIITVKAFDDVGNNTIKDITVNLQRGIKESSHPEDLQSKPAVRIVSPQVDSILNHNSFPVKVNLNLKEHSLAQRVNLYYNDKNGNPIIIGSVLESLSENLSIDWQSPPVLGTYSLYAVLIDKNGESYRDEIEITIN